MNDLLWVLRWDDLVGWLFGYSTDIRSILYKKREPLGWAEES